MNDVATPGATPAPDLRRLAQQLIEAALLPGSRPRITHAGSGTGSRCALCRRIIGENEIETTLVFEPDAAHGTLSLHVACHRAWLAACLPRPPGA